VIGMRVDAHTPASATRLIAGWAARRHDGYPRPPARVVCAANVHMTMEAYDDPTFAAVVEEADCVLPDGMPLVWALRLLGVDGARRVRMAPDLVLHLLHHAARNGLRVGLYGGTEETLTELRRRLAARIPDLTVAYCHAPPFRPLSEPENAAVVEAIRDASVDLLFVGIGCPRQERWMAAHRDDLDCVMLGVGYAFDLLAGRRTEAPVWLQRAGLEWTHRLAQDPKRLWRRYARHNPRFMALLAAQGASEGFGRRAAKPSGTADRRARTSPPVDRSGRCD
jgi:N-acetylglucosaminyldiphosphoundecaprenol N-acetyl-beta-D-mannosaminyltransferase